MTWDMHQDLAAFFGWKQVGVGFLNLVSRQVEVRRQVVHVTSSQRLHRVDAEDGWVDPVGCGGPFYFKIIIFYVSSHRGMWSFSILVRLINMILEGYDSLPFFLSSFSFIRLESGS
jgi:hypothetical protein